MKNPNIKNPESENEDVDLTKALDENLEKMNDLIKSKSDESVEELLKSAEGRKKLKEKMAEAEDEGSEADEKEDEAEEEDKEEEAPKMKGKIKKSFDEAVEANEDVIDAVPVLKSFVSVIDRLINEINLVKSKVEDIKKVTNENNEIQKSLCGVVKTESELIKSINETIEVIGGQPGEVKGIVTKSDKKGIIQKSFGNEQEVDQTIPFSAVQGALLKGFETGKVTAHDVAKWELSNYNLNACSEAAKVFVKSFVGGNN